MALFKGDVQICSFCGQKENARRRVVPGPGVAICQQCINLCIDYLNDLKNDEYSAIDLDDIPPPREFKEYLDQYVIGQDKAKRVLSVAVYNHYKRIARKRTEDDVEVEKSNVLLIGPTGSGKTLLAKTLAQKMHVPFAIADATTLTEAGYVGEDVENILLKLIQNAGGDIVAAERGIIFIDEIDKISRKSENMSITRDVSGEGVQQALLKIIEGTVASVPPQGGRKHPSQDMLKIDTSNILFICGGAFVDLDKIVESRVAEHAIGFGAEVKSAKEKNLQELYSELTPDDLVKFGLIPELIGRLPITVALNELTKEDLRRVLTEPKNSVIKQFQAFFELDNVQLTIDDDALDAIAQQTITQNTGARGLRAIVEKLFLDAMFESPSIKGKKMLHITKENVLNPETVKVECEGEKSA